MTVRSGMASDAGAVRARNEDCALAGAGVFAVADGMGGHAAGDIASHLAIGALRRLADQPGLTPDDLRGGLAAANREILGAVREHPGRTGMGTTLAGLGLVRFAGTEHWVVFNVGDSRVYRFLNGALAQVTVDHVAPGAGPGITRALGREPAPEADVWMFPPTPGERFLICSDGLPLEVDDASIAGVLAAEPSAQLAAETLVRRAVDAGGRDNVTAVVVDHVPADDEELYERTVPPRAAR